MKHQSQEKDLFDVLFKPVLKIALIMSVAVIGFNGLVKTQNAKTNEVIDRLVTIPPAPAEPHKEATSETKNIVHEVVPTDAENEKTEIRIGRFRVVKYGPGEGVMEVKGLNASKLVILCAQEKCAAMIRSSAHAVSSLHSMATCYQGEEIYYEIGWTHESGTLLCAKYDSSEIVLIFDYYDKVLDRILEGGNVTFYVNFHGGNNESIFSFYVKESEFLRAQAYLREDTK